MSSEADNACGKRGIYKAPRKDNVRNHIRDHHKLPILPAEKGKFECATGNCSNERTHGLVFDSATSLQKHRSQFHPVTNLLGESLMTEFKTGKSLGNGVMYTRLVDLVTGNLDMEEKFNPNCTKRIPTPIESSSVKRCKTVERLAGAGSQLPPQTNGSRSKFLTPIDPNAAPHCDVHSPFEVVENVKPAEFLAISRSESRFQKTICLKLIIG